MPSLSSHVVACSLANEDGVQKPVRPCAFRCVHGNETICFPARSGRTSCARQVVQKWIAWSSESGHMSSAKVQRLDHSAKSWQTRCVNASSLMNCVCVCARYFPHSHMPIDTVPATPGVRKWLLESEIRATGGASVPEQLLFWRRVMAQMQKVAVERNLKLDNANDVTAIHRLSFG